MKIFSYLYDKTLIWARHRHAPYYLTGVSVAESIFFPIPVDAMLVPMGLANPSRALFYAWLATFGSVLGAVFGYALGVFLLHWILPVIKVSGYYASYQMVHHWFDMWGIWIIFIAGFTPLPYKVFTISAGALRMPILPFILISIVARGARFYLVSGLLYLFAERVEPILRRIIDLLGWLTVVLLLLAYWYFHS